MATPERPNLVPYIEAGDYLWNSIARIGDEMDTLRCRGQSIEGTFDQRPNTPPDWDTITDPQFNQIRKQDMRKYKKLEKNFRAFSQAFDALTHNHNIPFVVSFLRVQARELGKQKTDPDYFKRSQHLRCLAADLNRAA